LLLVDTGVLFAAADTDEPRHGDCARLLRTRRAELLVVAPVVAEASWLIEDRLGPGAEAAFLRAVARADLRVIDLDRADYQRCVELIEQYADVGLGFVDASIVAVAERERIGDVATLNHRDFRAVRPRHIESFELLP
jgi:predicted nucleic acid-binding protein